MAAYMTTTDCNMGTLLPALQFIRMISS